MNVIVTTLGNYCCNGVEVSMLSTIKGTQVVNLTHTKDPGSSGGFVFVICQGSHTQLVP